MKKLNIKPLKYNPIKKKYKKKKGKRYVTYIKHYYDGLRTSIFSIDEVHTLKNPLVDLLANSTISRKESD